MIHPNSHESILSMYRDMIDYYLDNIGKESKYSPNKMIISIKMIKNVVKRYNQIVPDINKIVLNGELNDREE